MDTCPQKSLRRQTNFDLPALQGSRRSDSMRITLNYANDSILPGEKVLPIFSALIHFLLKEDANRAKYNENGQSKHSRHLEWIP
eukprot:1347606-Amorphochlora_amoeboformis.AAC.1